MEKTKLDSRLGMRISTNKLSWDTEFNLNNLVSKIAATIPAFSKHS